MKIGIDYTPAYEQGGGIGRLVRDLVAALAVYDTSTDYRLFVAGALQEDLPPPLGNNFIWTPTRITPKWLARIWHRARLPLPIELVVGNVDLYHATDFVLPPTLPTTKTIVTVHDMSYVRVPDAASPQLRAYLNVVVPRSVHRADLVIADSAATKADLVTLYGVDPEKVEVLLSGIDERYQPVTDSNRLLTIRNKYNLPDRPYIFAVGTVQPRKNYSRVIRAVRRLRDAGYDIDFVIAGGKGWLEDEMYQTIADTNMSEYVHLIGYADDVDLPILYSFAECVAFPSLYEGFGFPVLEGMACGTPVVTANNSSLPEVAGDAALMVDDPLNVDEITEMVRRVLDDSTLRQQMIERGYQQAAQFTWETSAAQLADIYRRVLNS